MQKKISVSLRNVPTTPSNLREIPSNNKPRSEIIFDLSRLYHHYYLDTYGQTPSDPNVANFEFLEFITNEPYLRFKSGGLGASTSAKRNKSTELGQAFFRLFLYDHFNITYFAHMDKIIDKPIYLPYGSCKVERVAAGDVPDYICAENDSKVFIGEAKGRYNAIGFNNKEFQEWRNQFNRITVLDKNNKPIQLKGYIVATRFVTEDNRTSTLPCLYAEDPETKGEKPSDEFNQNFSNMVKSVHYSNIFAKLNQRIASFHLFRQNQISDELTFTFALWELVFGPYAGLKFVGGYFAGPASNNMLEKDGHFMTDPSILNSPTVTFFGLEKKIAQQVIGAAKTEYSNFTGLEILATPDTFYSGASFLRDGSLICPIEMVRYIGLISM